jgi:hypothetical protein
VQRYNDDRELLTLLLESYWKGSKIEQGLKPETFATDAYKVLTFVLGNLHCSLLKIPDLKVFDVADLNANKEDQNTAT